MSECHLSSIFAQAPSERDTRIANLPGLKRGAGEKLVARVREAFVSMAVEGLPLRPQSRCLVPACDGWAGRWNVWLGFPERFNGLAGRFEPQCLEPPGKVAGYQPVAHM